MKCILFKKYKNTYFLDYGGGGIFYVHSTFCVDDVKWLHSVSYWRFLPQHNSEYTAQKIKSWYDTTLCGFRL